jgi:hypothetical protein
MSQPIRTDLLKAFDAAVEQGIGISLERTGDGYAVRPDPAVPFGGVRVLTHADHDV